MPSSTHVAGLLLLDWKEIGKRLQRAREDAGFDQDQAAALVGKPGPGGRVTVSRWETGKNRIPIDAIQVFAKAYGVSLQDLAVVSGFEVIAESSTSAPRGTFEGVRDETPSDGDDSWSPNPALRSKIPARAYEVAIAYCTRLHKGGWPREEIEQIERLMIDPRFAQANKRKGHELTEDEYIMLIDATWMAVQHSAAALGRQL